MKNVYAPDGSSAPYNMALVGYGQKVNLNARGYHFTPDPPPPDLKIKSVHCDKLALGAWTSIPPQLAEVHTCKAHKSYITAGRYRGMKATRRAKVWTAPPNVEGWFYVQVDHCDGDTSAKLRIEYNPAKMATDAWPALRQTLDSFGVRDPRAMWIDRYDAAFDYVAKRRFLILDDRSRRMDMFEVGPRGPQTERTGFRKGSLLKAQLYDKSAERAAKRSREQTNDGFITTSVSRFELQVLKPEPISHPHMFAGPACPDRMQVGDLPYAKYPGGGITVRRFHFHPLRVADPVFRNLAACARGLGLRFALNQAKMSGLSGEKRRQLLDVMMPEVSPSPVCAWRDMWRKAAERTVGQLCGVC